MRVSVYPITGLIGAPNYQLRGICRWVHKFLTAGHGPIYVLYEHPFGNVRHLNVNVKQFNFFTSIVRASLTMEIRIVSIDLNANLGIKGVRPAASKGEERMYVCNLVRASRSTAAFTQRPLCCSRKSHLVHGTHVGVIPCTIAGDFEKCLNSHGAVELGATG